MTLIKVFHNTGCYSLHGNKYEPKVANSTSNVHDKSNCLYDTRKVISSPSTRANWVPKFLSTNLKGPNETWVPKLVLKAIGDLRCIEDLTSI
jgi:hypothetical protein